MTYILNIETATKNCSVSIAEAGKTIALKELNDGNYSHAEKLHALIEQVVLETKISLTDINAIAVSKGPGSYTGLRIGVSAAKGLCFALDIPLISVNTLQSLAQSVTIDKGYKIPLLDARRMEVYSQVFSEKNEKIRAVYAEIIDSDSFSDFLKAEKVYFFGDGAQKCKETIIHENAVFIDHKFPSAKEMSAHSYQKYLNNDFEDLAYFEPLYLKEFLGEMPKK